MGCACYFVRCTHRLVRHILTHSMCIATALQALLAGGTYNGELVIWDLNKEDADAQVGTHITRCYTSHTTHSCVFPES
jgi:hypothetical protein